MRPVVGHGANFKSKDQMQDKTETRLWHCSGLTEFLGVFKVAEGELDDSKEKQ
jgi:hypothetical protein